MKDIPRPMRITIENMSRLEFTRMENMRSPFEILGKEYIPISCNWYGEHGSFQLMQILPIGFPLHPHHPKTPA